MKKCKEDYEFAMEYMEKMLDAFEEYIDKADEAIKKLETASEEASKFQEKFIALREEIKDIWRTL